MRRLIITESNGIVRIDSNVGQIGAGRNIESALRKAAATKGMEDLEIHSVFEAAETLDELMGAHVATEQFS